MHIFAYKCTQLASRKAVLLGAAGAGSLAGCAAFWQENAKKTYRKWEEHVKKTLRKREAHKVGKRKENVLGKREENVPNGKREENTVRLFFRTKYIYIYIYIYPYNIYNNDALTPMLSDDSSSLTHHV